MSSNTGVLYIGITNNLARRINEHKLDLIEGFTKKYQCHQLIYVEQYANPRDAIAREKQLKKWSRAKKEKLINQQNPKWENLVL